MISVIVPGRSFKKDPLLISIYNRLVKISEVELIFVLDENDCPDGCMGLEFKSNSRAKKINYGAEKSKNELLIIHHPRSVLGAGAIRFLKNNIDSLYWGGFTHKFDKSHWFLKFTSWYSNEVRSKIRGIIYLDHCIYVKKDMFKKVQGVPELDIFEDTLFSEKLCMLKWPKILPYYSQTSAVRFTEHGVFKQALSNQVLKLAYFFGISHIIMNKFYERKLELNSKYQNLDL